MGFFDLFKKKNIEKNEDLVELSENLKNSFLNVKKDMSGLHKTVEDHTIQTNLKIQSIELRMERIEGLLMNQFTTKVKPQEQVLKEEQKISEEQEIEPYERDLFLETLKVLPRAELKLFATLYELQNSLNAKHISYKSLASYLYPGKEYNSIRSTITQFILRLHSEGLIDKQRIGKEVYVKVTPHGQKLLKNTKIKNLIKESETIEHN